MEWISVEDRLPKNGDPVLYYDGYFSFLGHIDNGYRWHSFYDGDRHCHVTHWMPLPEPPTKGEDDV